MLPPRSLLVSARSRLLDWRRSTSAWWRSYKLPVWYGSRAWSNFRYDLGLNDFPRLPWNLGAHASDRVALSFSLVCSSVLGARIFVAAICAPSANVLAVVAACSAASTAACLACRSLANSVASSATCAFNSSIRSLDRVFGRSLETWCLSCLSATKCSTTLGWLEFYRPVVIMPRLVRKGASVIEWYYMSACGTYYLMIGLS